MVKDRSNGKPYLLTQGQILPEVLFNKDTSVVIKCCQISKTELNFKLLYNAAKESEADSEFFLGSTYEAVCVHVSDHRR